MCCVIYGNNGAQPRLRYVSACMAMAAKDISPRVHSCWLTLMNQSSEGLQESEHVAQRMLGSVTRRSVRRLCVIVCKYVCFEHECKIPYPHIANAAKTDPPANPQTGQRLTAGQRY